MEASRDFRVLVLEQFGKDEEETVVVAMRVLAREERDDVFKEEAFAEGVATMGALPPAP